MVGALVVVLAVGGVWAGAGIIRLGLLWFKQRAEIEQLQLVNAYYAKALERPAVAMFTHDQIELLASHISGAAKKEYLN
jgi:hypothetical protein